MMIYTNFFQIFKKFCYLKLLFSQDQFIKMPRNKKKSVKMGKKRKNKAKLPGSTKISTKKKKTEIFAVDPVQRQIAKSTALEARLYFQKAELANKDNQIQRARELQVAAESELAEFKETMEEVSAFTTWQHEHTVGRLTDRLKELTLANERLTEEKNDLQKRLEDAREESNATLVKHAAEVERLNSIIKESHYKYEKTLGDFSDKLVKKLAETWENEKTFLQDLEEIMCDEFMQNGLISTVNE